MEQTADAVPPARSHEGRPDANGALVDLWLTLQVGRGGRAPSLLPSAFQLAEIARLATIHGPEEVRRAMETAARKTRNGSPSLEFVEKLLVEGIHEQGRRTAPEIAPTHAAGITDRWAEHVKARKGAK